MIYILIIKKKPYSVRLYLYLINLYPIYKLSKKESLAILMVMYKTVSIR